MNALEVNALFTRVALVDPRVKRNNPDEQALVAQAWAAVLKDISMQDALEAAEAHYRRSTDVLMPAHVVMAVRAERRARYGMHPPAPEGKQWAVDILEGP